MKLSVVCFLVGSWAMLVFTLLALGSGIAALLVAGIGAIAFVCIDETYHLSDGTD